MFFLLPTKVKEKRWTCHSSAQYHECIKNPTPKCWGDICRGYKWPEAWSYNLIWPYAQTAGKKKVLDVIITDLWRFYQEPKIIPAIPVNKGEQGVPSDHKGVLLLPLENYVQLEPPQKEVLVVQPMPQSLTNEDWP